MNNNVLYNPHPTLKLFYKREVIVFIATKSINIWMLGYRKGQRWPILFVMCDLYRPCNYAKKHILWLINGGHVWVKKAMMPKLARCALLWSLPSMQSHYKHAQIVIHCGDSNQGNGEWSSSSLYIASTNGQMWCILKEECLHLCWELVICVLKAETSNSTMVGNFIRNLSCHLDVILGSQTQICECTIMFLIHGLFSKLARNRLKYPLFIKVTKIPFLLG